MRLNINIRIFFSLLTLLFLMTIFNISNANAAKPSGTSNKSDQVECSGNGTGTLAQPGTTNCEFEPDEFKITFFRLELCTSDPTPPTTTTTFGRESCSTFFRNDDGAEISVQKGIAGQIGESGDYSSLPHGTYTHGIITMKTTFKYKSSILFAGAMGDTGGGGNTTTCVTKAPGGGASTVIYGYHNGLNAAGSNVDCGAGAVAEEIILGINLMSMDGDDDCNHLLNFVGTNGTVEAYLLEDDDTLHDGVGATDTDQIKNGEAGCESASSNGVTKITGVMPLGDPIVIGPTTSGLQMEYNTTQSLALGMTGTANDIYKFEVAFFDFTLTAKNKARARGAWR